MLTCSIDESATYYNLFDGQGPWEVEAPLYWDLNYLTPGIHDFALAAGNDFGESDPVHFQIFKGESSIFATYKIYYTKADKQYFDTKHIFVKFKW